MTNRENVNAILHYQPYEKMPVVNFGYWGETLQKWADEGHLTRQEADGYAKLGPNSAADRAIMDKLGFDFNWASVVGANVELYPPLERRVLQQNEDGSQIIRDPAGLIVKVHPGVTSIPAEIGTSMTGREAWETLYLPRLQFDMGRIPLQAMKALPPIAQRDVPVGLHMGSLMGNMRNMLGVQELSYLYADDEELYVEIINTLCDLCYRCTKTILEAGVEVDYVHFWEDICYKNGPLVIPSVFEEYVGPHYKKITDMVKGYGLDIISLDCDGIIDTLLPTWFENGVNTMFPIEVGTWGASIAPWREKYGKQLRGVGGMNKTVFARDKAAVEQEVARLKELIKLGGYLPCVDHLIPPDAKFELVQYYCRCMKEK